MNNQVRDVFEKNGYKIYYDGSGKRVREDKFFYYELRGKHGMVYPYSEKQLAAQAYHDTGRKPTGFVKSKGYEIIQDASDALVFLFPVSDFKQIAKRLQLRKRNKMTKKQLANLKQGPEKTS